MGPVSILCNVLLDNAQDRILQQLDELDLVEEMFGPICDPGVLLAGKPHGNLVRHQELNQKQQVGLVLALQPMTLHVQNQDSKAQSQPARV